MGREPGSWGAAGLWSKRTHPGQRRPRPLEAPDPQPLTPESRAFTALLLPGTRGAARGMVWTRQAEETSTAAKVTLQAGPTAPSTLSPVHEGPASPAVRNEAPTTWPGPTRSGPRPHRPTSRVGAEAEARGVGPRPRRPTSRVGAGAEARGVGAQDTVPRVSGHPRQAGLWSP